jgi:hypothetical protein
MNEHNFIRAEALTLGSLEFFALLVIVIYSIIRYKGNLIPTYVLFVPFTDKVYRIFDIQIADILGVLIICSAVFKNKLPLNGYAVIIFCIFEFGGWVGGYYFGDFFSLLYIFRVSIIVLASIAIADELRRSPALFPVISEAYRFVVIFSVAVATLQALLWLLGLPIDGVFWVGYIRVKGLAHEPSTFGVWLALSLPLIIQYKKLSGEITIDKLLLGAILLGTALTSSAAAFLTLCLVGLLMISNNPEISSGKKMHFFLGLIFGCIVLITAFNDIFYKNIILKALTYLSELVDPALEDTSGRGGDRYLFLLLAQSPYTGIGAFRSSKAGDLLAELGMNVYVPGSNFYITTIVEFGLIVGPLVLLVVFAWIFWLIRTTLKVKSQWGCSVIGWFFAISAMRIFGFHQPWLNYALFIGKK